MTTVYFIFAAIAATAIGIAARIHASSLEQINSLVLIDN